MKLMLSEVDKMPPYEKMHFLVFKQDVDNSYNLNETQKRQIEIKLQEIVDIWNTKNT